MADNEGAADVKQAENVTAQSQPSPGDIDQIASQELGKMDQKIIAQAREILASPDLIDQVVNDIHSMGVAGETDLARIIYLVGTSRLLERPLAAIVRGHTSAGKSYVINSVAKLFPPEMVIHAHRITPQALVHLPQGSLVRRFVVAGERSLKRDSDAVEATRALREMLGDGYLSKLITVKDKKGGFATQEIHQPGPIAYVESTTLGATEILDEDRSRCLLLTVDETAEQTQRIIMGEATRRAGTLVPSNDKAQVVLKHHAMQRMLRPVRIQIPYAPDVGRQFPANTVEARRIFPHLLSLIEGSALLHQYQRSSVNDNGKIIVATTEDLVLATSLLSEYLSQRLHGIPSKSAVRLWENLRQNGKELFTIAEAATISSKSQTAVRGYLKELIGSGNVERVIYGSGREPDKYKLVADKDVPRVPLNITVGEGETAGPLPGREHVHRS